MPSTPSSWSGPDGVRRPVRFSWKPVAGVETTKDTTEAPVDDYLQGELRDRLKQWPARMMLMMMIGEAGDVLEDPTVPWPAQARARRHGHADADRTSPRIRSPTARRLSFNPWRLVTGIEPSADPLLKARRDAYEESRKGRGVTQCPFLPK